MEFHSENDLIAFGTKTVKNNPDTYEDLICSDSTTLSRNSLKGKKSKSIPIFLTYVLESELQELITDICAFSCSFPLKNNDELPLFAKTSS
jgi:hypothetical protein